jgi:MFS transporter, ACS family, hexuronate transporter
MLQTVDPKQPQEAARATHYRWVVCALLFFATTINYVDREVLAVLGPSLTEEFGWSEKEYGLIVVAFTLAYALSYAGMGRLMDRIGVRRGFILAVTLWSLAAMAHGLIHPLVYKGLPWFNAAFAGTFLGGLTRKALSIGAFSVARFALGLSEGGNFPGAIKTVGEWHPKRERALATGIFNSGSNLGVVLAAAIIPLVIRTMGWDWDAAFYVTGALGFLWLMFWIRLYRNPAEHPRVNKAELAHIQSDPPDPPAKIPWISLLRHRQTWAYTIGMFLASPVWWFYLFWTPKFLKNNLDIDLHEVLWPLLVIYSMADVGSVGGGGLSSWLLRRGASLNVARKTAFLICAVCVVPVVLVTQANNMWTAALLIGLAAAAHQGFSANLYTIVSDTVPRKAVSSVVGIGGAASCGGSIVFSMIIGVVLDWTEKVSGRKEYLIPFVMAGSAYLVATVVIHLILPRLEPMKLDPECPTA